MKKGVVGKVILVGVALYAASKLVAASVASNINIIVSKVNASFSGLDILLLAQNVTSGSFTINSIVGDCYVNGDKVGNFSYFGQTIIKANSETQLPITVRIPIGGLISSLQDLFSNRNPSGIVVRLVGNANAENVLVPLDITYKVI